MTNLLKTNVAQHGLTKLIQRLGRDCTPTQFVREFTMNSIEAVQRTKKPGQIYVDVNWDIFERFGVHKICFIDNGDGMTADEMREHLNNLSSSGAEQNIFENYGMGAKIAALTRNHAGVIYDSWKDGVGHRIVIKYDENERAYGIARTTSEDGQAHWNLPLSDSEKPKLIGDHGTRVTLMGMKSDEDTMQPPTDAKGGAENWLYQYLNTRFFRVPEKVEMQVRIGYYRPADNTKHNYTRKIKGQKETLDSYATASGVISLSDARVHWWILDNKRAGHGREYVVGHTGCINQNELFDLADGRSNRAAGFGVIFGKEDVILYVEPRDGYVQDTTRTRLVQNDGSALPWDRWQDEFREKMPSEIKQFMSERIRAAENQSHSESIRERLRSISKFFRLSRYRRSVTGTHEADPNSETKGRVGTGTGFSEGGGGYRKGEDGNAAGMLEAILLSGVKEGGLRADEVTPDKFPEVRWISIVDGTRSPDELDDRAAEYLEKDNLIRANADFQGFVDIIEHFSALYAEVPGSESIVKNDVQEVFEQQLIEVVAGALSFKNRPKWTPDQFKQAVSEEALTAAVMCRYHLVNHIRRSVGGKLGKAGSKLAEA